MTFGRLRSILDIVSRPLLGCLFAAGAIAPLSAQTCEADCLIGCASLASCDDGGCDGYESEEAALFPGVHAARNSLAESGITFQNNLTQFYIGNTTGGNGQAFRYSGHGDYVTNFDFGKLGVQEGLFLKIRAEHRFGRSLRNLAGSVLPPAIATELPTANDERLFISNFLLTQALSENFALFAGKLDTLDGDVNAYAHSRGINQFLNTAFVANPIALRTVPYSTLGAGFVLLSDVGEPIFTFTILNATDTVETDGFSELFNEGAVVTAEVRLPTNLLGMPGHQLFGGSWSSRTYASLDQDPRIVLPNIPIATQTGSWSLYWNCDQALVGDETNNWGYFARAGIADDDSNPIAYFLSSGLGGASPLRCRENDSFGIGYFYSGTSQQISPFIQNVLGQFGDGQGVELFYNARVNPLLSVTPDLQILDPARASLDTALIAGVRANLAF